MSTAEFSIHNDLEELDTLAEKVLEFCEQNHLSDEFSYDIRLALEEAISNTIKYGYRDQEVHVISVKTALQNNRLLIEIEDDAAEFNPLQTPLTDVSLPIEQKNPGGLGIYLLRSIMNELEYERQGSKNIFRMTKLNGSN